MERTSHLPFEGCPANASSAQPREQTQVLGHVDNLLLLSQLVPSPMNGPWLRLLRLACLALLRRAGLAPWLLLLAGVGWSTLVEPALLRRSGLPLIETSAHAWALLVLLSLAFDHGVRVPRIWHRVALSGLTTLVLAAAQALIVAAMLALRGYPGEPSGQVARALAFFCAWWPVAATASSAFRGWSNAVALMAQVSVGIEIVTSPWGERSLALGLLSLATVLAMTPRRPSDNYANRYSW